MRLSNSTCRRRKLIDFRKVSKIYDQRGKLTVKTST